MLERHYSMLSPSHRSFVQSPCRSLNGFFLNHTTFGFTVLRHLAQQRKETCNYETLGVSPQADSKQIKQAYYEKSKEYHPDLNQSPDAAVKFQQVNAAYEVLSNEQLKDEYDYNKGYKGHRPGFTAENGNGSGTTTYNYNRQVYRQVRRHNSYQFYEPKLANRWIKVKHDTEFYDHLSPEMKAAYKTYIDRVKREQEELKEHFDSVKQNRSGFSLLKVYTFLVSLTIVIIIFERV